MKTEEATQSGSAYVSLLIKQPLQISFIKIEYLFTEYIFLNINFLKNMENYISSVAFGLATVL